MHRNLHFPAASRPASSTTIVTQPVPSRSSPSSGKYGTPTREYRPQRVHFHTPNSRFPPARRPRSSTNMATQKISQFSIVHRCKVGYTHTLELEKYRPNQKKHGISSSCHGCPPSLLVPTMKTQPVPSPEDLVIPHSSGKYSTVTKGLSVGIFATWYGPLVTDVSDNCHKSYLSLLPSGSATRPEN